MRHWKDDSEVAECVHCDRISGISLFAEAGGADQRRSIRQRQVHVYPIRNDFFGEQITVSGLITGQDLIASAERQGAWETSFCFPAICSEAERKYCWMMLPCPRWKMLYKLTVDIVKSSGQDFIEAIL